MACMYLFWYKQLAVVASFSFWLHALQVFRQIYVDFQAKFSALLKVTAGLFLHVVVEPKSVSSKQLFKVFLHTAQGCSLLGSCPAYEAQFAT